MSFRKNVITKKLVRYYNNTIRPLRLLKYQDTDWTENPPILVNSSPKSGTHLLHQIISDIPGLIDYGNFIASTPSFTFKEVPAKEISKRLFNILPGEIVASHIHFNDEYDTVLTKRNIVKLFIYRDLRDVTISEAHYLSKMNKWHKLSPEFSKLTSLEARIKLSLNGLPDNHPIDYPNVVERFKKYKGWLTSHHTLSIRFEDLISTNSEQHLAKIAEKYINSYEGALKLTNSELIALFKKAIDPKKSHTFRSGKKEQWKQIYTEEMNNRYLTHLKSVFSDSEIESLKLI